MPTHIEEEHLIWGEDVEVEGKHGGAHEE